MTGVDGELDYRRAADEYAKTLAGFALLNDDPAAVAARLGSSPIKEQLVATLDDWASVAAVLRKSDLAEQLLALARQAAPDPDWGDRLRRLNVWRDPQALDKLVAQAPAAGLSPQLCSLVGVLLRGVDSPLRESWLRQAQAEHPADFWLNYSLFGALYQTNPTEAAGFCRAAIAVRPGSSDAYNILGMALERQGKLDGADGAIAAYHKATALNLKNDVAYHNLGKILMDQKKLDDAIACFHKAIALNPKNFSAYNNLGIALHDQGKLDAAIAAYGKAIEINPKYANVHYNLGIARKDQGKLDEAVAAYHKAIECDPKYASAHYNLGLALKAQGKLDEAIAAYREAIELDPKSAGSALSALIERGWDLANNPDPKLRDPKRAVELVKEAVELAPLETQRWQYLGWIQYRAGNWTASIETLEKSCKLQPDGTGDSGQWIVLALAHTKLAAQVVLPERERDHHKAEARRWYEQADKWIDSQWRVRPSHAMGQNIWDFRAEARELMGIEKKKD